MPDAAAWRAWLDRHEDSSDGVWLTLAKKGTTTPTSLTYAEALDEARCSGWIDGRKHAVDTATYRQHFTPRRARSMWSKRNVDHVTRLIDTGRMRDRGIAEIERAKADGRWDRAYEGSAAITVPADLRAALDAEPHAEAAFQTLSKSARYPILLDIGPPRTTPHAQHASADTYNASRHRNTLSDDPPRIRSRTHKKRSRGPDPVHGNAPWT
ncbi:YdeI/OmpD-associated family protein [Microbacterium aurantiacum]|uniref:YdeI/OmpD-associated family protein n=1 Tax=Microbacterium aurantiacum TaxID=162393 RepID=UPI002ED88A97